MQLSEAGRAPDVATRPGDEKRSPVLRAWRWLRWLVLPPLVLWLILGLTVSTWAIFRSSPDPPQRPLIAAQGPAEIRLRFLMPAESILSQTWRGDLRYLYKVVRSGHAWLQSHSWISDDNPSGSYGFYFPGEVIGEDLAAGEATHQVVLRVQPEQAAGVLASILTSQAEPPSYTLLAIDEGRGNCISWMKYLLDAHEVQHPLAMGDTPYDLLTLRQLEPVNGAVSTP
jgi:hypothetical protein